MNIKRTSHPYFLFSSYKRRYNIAPKKNIQYFKHKNIKVKLLKSPIKLLLRAP